jgi:hypothetical protein
MNNHLKTADLVREHIDYLLPTDTVIDKDKLNINLSYLTDVTKDINTDIPLSMSVIFGLYAMSNFASQFQWKLNLNGSRIPNNMVGFLLSKSGNGKDSSMSAMRKALDPGYALIEGKREEAARKKAQDRADAEGEDNWQKYYKEPQPLDNSISTVEGLTSRLNNFSAAGLGMPSVMVSELGSELQTNPNMSDNIRLISECFDTGDKKSKAIKDTERQDAEVKGMGMCAMFVGSEDNIILDKQVSQKFKMEFVTKLARRSMFVYPSEDEFQAAMVEYNSYEDMVKKQDDFEYIAAEAKAYIGSKSMDIAAIMLDKEQRLLEIDDDALRAYKDYKMYTTALGNGIDYIYKSVELEQMHRSWKMLKLATTFAIWDTRDTVSIQDIEEAIYIVEMIGPYLSKYEEYASKNPYELLVDYFDLHPDHTLSLHELNKRGFVAGTANIENKVKELVRLADSFAGNKGIVKYEGDIVSFKQFEAVGDHYASYVEAAGSKQERALKCHSGFAYKQTTFAKLKALLENDTAYTPFKFKDGKRSNDNIISGATWVAIDVDDTDIDMYEMHDILSEYNHHIASTSNSDNPYKYRIILEFNNIVDLPPREWKSFLTAIVKELGLDADPITYTKSQIQFGYKGSKVLSVLDESPYDIANALKEASKIVGIGKEQKPTITQARKLLDNPLETFSYAFNDNVPARSLAMFRMWKHCKDLGGNKAECEQVMRDLNYNFWADPIDDKRFDSYVQQMQKSFEEK